MLSMVKRLFSDESGASMVEYGLLVALIAVVAVVAVTALGNAVTDKFSYTAGVIGQ
jgi:pilus assembly protein Flp/PilA